MTPEEKYTEIIKICSSADYTREQAIEAIKQYARDMCDKQRNECVELWNDTESGNDIRDYNAIKNAPYPKELL